MVIFNLYDPKIPIKEDYFIFNSFQPYSSQEVNTVMNRIQKLYTRQKIDEEDFLMLKPITIGRRTNKDTPNLNQTSSSFKSPTIHKSQKLNK